MALWQITFQCSSTYQHQVSRSSRMQWMPFGHFQGNLCLNTEKTLIQVILYVVNIIVLLFHQQIDHFVVLLWKNHLFHCPCKRPIGSLSTFVVSSWVVFIYFLLSRQSKWPDWHAASFSTRRAADWWKWNPKADGGSALHSCAQWLQFWWGKLQFEIVFLLTDVPLCFRNCFQVYNLGSSGLAGRR